MRKAPWQKICICKIPHHRCLMGRYQKIANCSASIPSVNPRFQGRSVSPGLSCTPESVSSLTLLVHEQIPAPVSPSWATQVSTGVKSVHLSTSPWGAAWLCPSTIWVPTPLSHIGILHIFSDPFRVLPNLWSWEFSGEKCGSTQAQEKNSEFANLDSAMLSLSDMSKRRESWRSHAEKNEKHNLTSLVLREYWVKRVSESMGLGFWSVTVSIYIFE